MKVLIAYDGTECSDAAIVDLRRAGLPQALEASVLSVAEMSAAVEAAPYGVLVGAAVMHHAPAVDWDEPAGHFVEEAKSLADQAADRLRADFPDWHIETEAWTDAAGSAIVRKAHACGADLIVLGSHGRSNIGRLLLGSVSQHVLHHVACSVRISRHRLHSQHRAIRLLIGVDGSKNAEAAVHAVAARSWPVRTEVCVVGVLDSRIALAAGATPDGAIPVDIEDEFRNRMFKAVHHAVQELEMSGLRAAPLVLKGYPQEVLLAEAQNWGADCIFVGARGLNAVERVLLGSVSSGVAARAHCSVEVVRPHLNGCR